MFNNLEDGIFITQNNRILELNNACKQFFLQQFPAELVHKVVQSVIQNDKMQFYNAHQKKEGAKSKFQHFFEFVCCKRPQKMERPISFEEEEKYNEAEQLIMSTKMFSLFMTAKQKQNQMNKDTKIQEKEYYSLNDLLELQPSEIDGKSFKLGIAQDVSDTQTKLSAKYCDVYVQLKVKEYTRNKEDRKMVQFIDVTQTIMYEQVHNENQFLAITNATVSHELRNPLQSISCQNLKIDLCLKELLSIIKQESAKDKQFAKGTARKLKQIVKIMKVSNKIQNSSSKMMGFVVDDLLDFAQINNSKFRKNFKMCDLREVVDEVISIQ